MRTQRDRLERLALPLLRRRLVVELRQAWADFGASGGTIMAAGLAYRTMFATLTLLVFAAGLVGIVISDPTRRVDVINALVAVLPGPLHESLTASVDALGREGLTVGLVGLVGLFWGASSMYEALDQATSMILPGGRRRGGLDRRVRGLVAVAALTAVVGVFLALTPLVAAGFVDLGGRRAPGHGHRAARRRRGLRRPGLRRLPLRADRAADRPGGPAAGRSWRARP